MNNILSIKRILLLSRLELRLDLKNILIFLGAIFGIIMVINISSSGSSGSWDIHNIFYPLCLMIGGLIAASAAFSSLYDKRKAMWYMTIPASPLEKYLTRYLITTAGYIAGLTVVYFGVSLLSTLITQWLFGVGHPVFNPFTANTAYFIRLYIICHSVVFFGAVYFRRNNLLKTLLVLFLVGVAVSLLALVFLRIVFHEYFIGISFKPVTGSLEIIPSQEYLDFLENSARFMFYWLLAPFFWATGFIRLRETEV